MRVLLLVNVLVGSTKAGSGNSPNATQAEGEQYRNKMFSFLPESERENAKNLGMDKPTKLEIDLCMQRMTSEEVACALGKATQVEALACKPSVDIRPADAKRTAEECK